MECSGPLIPEPLQVLPEPFQGGPLCIAISGSSGSLSNLAGSSALSLSNNPPDWKEADKTARSVRHFLLSLDAVLIGTGLMWYDKDNFLLLPRSSWFNNHTFQWVVNIGNKTATFEAVQESLTTLISKIKTIGTSITVFDATHHDCVPPQHLLIDLIRLQIVIDGVAHLGLRRLADNYTSAAKQQKAASITALGSQAFEQIGKLRNELQAKLLPHVPGLDVTITLEQYAFKAKTLLQNRDAYRETLRIVAAHPATGLCIPADLIDQCLMDSTYNSKPNRDALRIAAQFICIPKMAQPIPTLGNTSFWMPLRLVKEGDIIVIDPGVWGTCERTSGGGDNICNVYFRVTPDTKQIAISCGALNTAAKAEQLAKVMQEALKFVPEANERWVVHQLNSFRQEARLIRDVHTHVYLNEGYFRGVLKNPGLSLLHFNTCFNSATMFASEDVQALKTINCDSLAKIAEYVLADLKQLLKGKPVLHQLMGEGSDDFKQKCGSVIRLADELKKLKQQIKRQNGCETLDRIASIENMMGVLKDNTIISGVKSELPSLFDSDETDEQRLKQVTLENERRGLEKDLPAQLKELNEQLLKKQEELEKCLVVFKTSIAAAILALQQSSDGSPDSQQALLILQVYEQILNVQLKQPGFKPLSRSTETELFLLLYRLLNIKPIIICWSGLDRSGAVRSLADAQARSEREFFDAALSQKPDRRLENQFAARVEACNNLYRMIINFDTHRDELFSMINAIVSQSKGQATLISDLTRSFASQPDPSLNIRDALFAKIDEKYPAQLGPKGEILKTTQRYLELVAGQLLGTEAEKTLFSTGVVGFKYLHDTYWPKSYFANPHPPDRWPMFCFVGNKAVKLLDFSEGWMSNSLNVTPAAITIFLRLSQLRGN